MSARLRALLASLCTLAVAAPHAAAQPKPGDFSLPEYRFESGERLTDVRLHYVTLGTPRRDATGAVGNAVLILHGTGGTGSQFLGQGFAGELYGQGQPLDTARFYVILPDNIGHGKSSKPSDGLHMRFPHYGYTDMVKLQRILLSKGLGVERPYIVMGTSMGCMHAWVWGTLFPDAARALVPLACAPTQIAGRNRMMRRMMMDAITQDRTIDRKLREMIIAIKIDRDLSKDQILEGYLNTIYYGRGAYGIQAAAKALSLIHI